MGSLLQTGQWSQRIYFYFRNALKYSYRRLLKSCFHYHQVSCVVVDDKQGLISNLWRHSLFLYYFFHLLFQRRQTRLVSLQLAEIWTCFTTLIGKIAQCGIFSLATGPKKWKYQDNLVCPLLVKMGFIVWPSFPFRKFWLHCHLFCERRCPSISTFCW